MPFLVVSSAIGCMDASDPVCVHFVLIVAKKPTHGTSFWAHLQFMMVIVNSQSFDGDEHAKPSTVNRDTVCVPFVSTHYHHFVMIKWMDTHGTGKLA